MTETNDRSKRDVRVAFVRLLRRCADYLDAMADEEVKAFLDGSVEIRLTVSSKNRTPKRKVSRPASDDTAILKIVADLQVAESRLIGEHILRDRAVSKAALQAVAKLLDVASRKEDTTEDLTRRIIEATIGYRLSSAAIHGKGVKRTGDDGAQEIEQAKSQSIVDQTKSEKS